jgi:hypothetical protein
VPVKTVVVVPAGTMTKPGTVRAAPLLERPTGIPPAGAAVLKVILQIVLSPDATDAGTQLRLDGTGGTTSVREAVAEMPLRLAVSTAVLSPVTVDAQALNAAVEAPAATVTEAGVVSKSLLPDSLTATPPAWAGADRVTMQLAVPFPTSEDGLQVSELNPAGAETGTETTPPAADVTMASPAEEADAAFEI